MARMIDDIRERRRFSIPPYVNSEAQQGSWKDMMDKLATPRVLYNPMLPVVLADNVVDALVPDNDSRFPSLKPMDLRPPRSRCSGSRTGSTLRKARRLA